MNVTLKVTEIFRCKYR